MRIQVRLNKDILRVAEGPVNLLETTNIHIFFKKTITSKPSFVYDNAN